MISFDTSTLLSLYTSRSGGAATPLATARKVPTAPWSDRGKETAPQASDLVRSVMAGRRFVDPSAARLDVKGASGDYRQLFAVYQGLNAMNALAERAQTAGVSAGELERLQTRFAAGLKEVSAYVDGLKLENLALTRAATGASARSTVGVPKDRTTYVGGVAHVGDPKLPAAAFDGEVRFTMTVARTNKPDAVIAVDLAAMGATPRTVANVVAHLNERLKAAGLDTRFAVQSLPAEPRTIRSGDKVVTVGPGEPRSALKVVGDADETLSFTADARADAVWIAQRAGTAETGVRQLVKLQTDVLDTPGAPPAAVDRSGELAAVEGRLSRTGLPDGVEAVRAAAAGPDGSTYLLADLKGTTSGQTIKGARDVGLIKLDSAGRTVWTRTLGAAETATGFALAVAPDGKIAVAGAVTGGLGEDDPVAAGRQSDSFLTLYDADGVEQWTERRAARLDDEARAVTFGADGAVYVAGRARSAVPLAGAAFGGWDGYLQKFTPRAGTVLAEPRGELTFAAQFGSAQDDSADAVAVDGADLYVAGVENGRAILRRYDTTSGRPVLTAARDLGALSGAIRGLAVENGRLYLTGESRNAALDAGTATRSHSGGSDAFVAALDPTLAAGAGDRLTWFGGSGADTLSAAQVVDGKVYLSGCAGADLPDLPARGARDGYVARLDPETGAVEWSRRFAADGGEVMPEALVVTRGGASVLDRLGLPQGEVPRKDSQRLVDAAALRPGDAFEVRVGQGRAVKVGIEADETLDTLARKIERAAGGRAIVTVVGEGDVRKLNLRPRDARADVTIAAPDAALDALAALGLPETTLRGAGAKGQAYALNLSADLRIDTKEGRKAVLDTLRAAMSRVRTAYNDLSAPPERKTSANGPVPEYLTRQLAAYQDALRRLGG